MKKWILVFLLAPVLSWGQTKSIHLDDIYKKGTFRSEFIPGFERENITDVIGKKSMKNEKGETLSFSNATVSNNQSYAIVRANIESIYRRSRKSDIYLFDIKNDKLTKITEGKALHASFSPDNSKIAYVKDNNLYLYTIATGTTKAVTTDGKWNEVINGNCDWVYEEEFSFTQAYEWSPKGSYLAYYRFDESQVKEYHFTMYNDTYNQQYSYKYPKAGDANSVVDIFIYDVANDKKVAADFEKGDIYIPRIKWTQSDDQLLVFWMNRHQNDLRVLNTHAQTGKSELFYQETNKYYVDINDDWQFLGDGKQVLFTSEKSGYNHIHLSTLDTKKEIQITNGPYEVTSINAVDEKNKRIYYTMAYPRPMDRNLFVVEFSGKNNTQLTQGEGWHRAQINKDFTQANIYRSDINTPESGALYNIVVKKGKVELQQQKVLGDNQTLKNKLQEYGFGQATFLQIPNSKGDILNGWMLKPANFDANKKYPVLFCNYGGPGSQQVKNQFGTVSNWHQMMAQKGFIIVSVDNTGTGFRGEEFKKKTYLQLGKLEIEDQIDAAKYLGTLSYVDTKNIGHYGWSYGGFMSSLAITKGAGVFTAAIAVAPVTSWRYYDNIYTERFMRTPQENPSGYDDNSPIHFTDKIKGKYLIIHGTADDNVHFQNATQMISALVKNNVDFESAYYPNKNHGISGTTDNTTYHLWNKMTNWLLENLGNENTKK